MEQFTTTLNQTFLGNTVADYLWFAGILLTGLVLKKFISKLLSRLLYGIFKRYGKHIGAEKFINLLSAPFGFLFLVIIVFVASDRLSFPREWNLDPENVFGIRFVLLQLFQGAMVLAITWVLIRLVEFAGLVISARAAITASRMDDQLVPFTKEIIKVGIAGIGLLVTLAVTFDLDVVSLVTGLGIGGLAIALAAKETLENLLGSFTIFLDKPFYVGDMVKVGAIEGRVESIGFRSTRIRSLDRMLVTMPNKKMVDAELINDTDRTVRRARFTIGLTYKSTEEQVKAVVRDIDAALGEHPALEPRHIVRFQQFGTSSLDILVIYFSRTPEIEDFYAVQEEINYTIMAIVRKNNVEFAYPSTTVFLRNQGPDFSERKGGNEMIP